MTERGPGADPTDDDLRSIRVFVSSTFRDMQDEREELVKRVFPFIRRMCEERGVAFSEVDLRWGVTDEQKADGAVLPICLAEIDRSRPYFIGLLGQRYGWVPDQLPEDLAARLPWLRGLAGTSVTEMEILHGVLNDVSNDSSATEQTYFYLRDPGWMVGAGEDRLALLAEQPGDEEIRALGHEGADAAAADRRRRLEQLKERVRLSGCPTADYIGPLDLGARVRADLTALVERLYPLDEVPDAASRENAAHLAYASAQVRGHVPRPRLVQHLDRFASGDDPPLVVSGEPGSGGSDTAVAWIDAWRRANPDDVVVQHHVRATTDAAEWVLMARRLAVALDEAHGSGPVTPSYDSPSAARASLFAAFARAGLAARRSVILVDGVDLLVDVDGAPDLTWLPQRVPASVRIVITAGGPRPAEAAQRRGWPVAEVPDLDDAERRQLIAAFLARFSKGLDEVHVARLVASPLTGNTLYLRTVLDELRQYGDHFTLGDVIERYLAADTLDDLLALVLTRYEEDFERDRPGLVGDAMRALWAARRGLTERELLDTLGVPGTPAAQAVWSPLMLAAEAGLVTRSGLLGFATEPHRRAVERRFLPTEAAGRAAHATLAATFAGYDIAPRVVEELPWQQLAAGDIGAMVATISDLRFTDLAFHLSHADLRRLWARAEDGGCRVIDGYRAVLDAPRTNPDATWQVARLVTDAGYPADAARLHRVLVELYRTTAERHGARLRASLVNLGSALWLQGDLAGAEPPLREALAAAEISGDDTVLRATLGDLGLSLRDQGRLAEADDLFRREEAMCRSVDDTDGLQKTLGNRVEVLRRAGDQSGALALAVEQEEVCRSTGDAMGVGRAQAGRAAVLSDQGRVETALPLFEAHRSVAIEQGDLRGAAESGISSTDALRQLGRNDEAAAVAADTEALLRRLDDGPLLARILDVRARMALDGKRWSDAAQLATEAVLTARRVDATASLLFALGSLGMAQRELGDLAAARAAHDEEELLASSAGQPVAAAMARVNLAAVEVAAGDVAAALHRYAQAEPVLVSEQLHDALSTLYANRAQVHLLGGQPRDAVDDLRALARSAGIIGEEARRHDALGRAVEILYANGLQADAEAIWSDLADSCRRLEDQPGLRRALGEWALLAIARSAAELAGRLLEDQELQCRSDGDQVGLASCLGNRAILLQQTGDLTGSLALIDQQLALAQEAGNAQSVLFAQANRGEVLGRLGRSEESLSALGTARTMAVNWGLTPMVTQLDQMIAAVHHGG
jgi:tetratricopeptide (TPR) repeat protein